MEIRYYKPGDRVALREADGTPSRDPKNHGTVLRDSGPGNIGIDVRYDAGWRSRPEGIYQARSCFVPLDDAPPAVHLVPVNDPVCHPKHYTGHPSGVECITVTEHMNFCLGNAMKYIWRCGEKGNKIEDLKKAKWYLEREIARLEKKGE